jgi:hypothetical protein
LAINPFFEEMEESQGTICTNGNSRNGFLFNGTGRNNG